ncbi:MAG: hypothetical protein K0R92_559 [Lachnospiraceae bacterium]|jgi:hypothetical protein|nr:hypothetical protein [Lachnospiraceae bacterium]
MEITNKKLWKIGLILWGIIISILIIIFIICIILKPKPDVNGFSTAIETYLSNNDNIIDLDYIDDDIYKITVSDVWYNSSEIEKIKFCNSIRNVFTTYAWEFNIISDSKLIYIYFYDKDQIKVAQPGFALDDYEILH